MPVNQLGGRGLNSHRGVSRDAGALSRLVALNLLLWRMAPGPLQSVKLHRNNDRPCDRHKPTDAEIRAQLRADEAEEQAEAERAAWNDHVATQDAARERMHNEFCRIEKREEMQ